MSNFKVPDRELFEEEILISYEYNEELRCDLEGIYRIGDEFKFIPCLYKKVLSYKNGFARVINMAGNLVYISSNGEKLFDYEFPFIPELCEDFDEDGRASIACLADGAFILKGYMNSDGEMFLKDYNS